MQPQIEKREIIKCLLLSIITCGIYAIFWIIKLGRETVKIKDPNDSGTLEIVLMLFVPCAGFYLAEKKFAEGAAARGIPHDDNSILYLVLGLFVSYVVDVCLLQNELNKLVDNGYAYDPNQGGNPPPQGGYQPPQGGYQPPQGGYQPPQGGYQPPQGGYQPPQGGYQPPQGGYQPPQGGYQPPQGGFQPPQDNN